MIAVSAREEWEFTLAEERGQDGATVFRLRPLTQRVRAEVEDLTRGETIKDTPIGTWKTKVLRAGLVGWRNVRDASGREVAFAADRSGCPNDETLARIPSGAQLEIAWEIFSRSSLSEADRKN